MADVVVTTFTNNLSFAGISDNSSFVVTQTGSVFMPNASVSLGQAGLNIYVAGYANFHGFELYGASTSIHIASTGVFASTTFFSSVSWPAELRLYGANSSLLNEGTITSIEKGVTTNGTSTITNFGLISGKAIGVQMNSLGTATDDALLNEGTIHGQTDCGVAVSFGEALVVNHGTIEAVTAPSSEVAAGIRASGFLTLNNSGRIEGSAFGLLFLDTATGTRIQNSGTIHGTLGAISCDTLGASFAMSLTNTGTISGEAYSLLGGSEADYVVNSGTIIGNASFGAGDDGLTTSRGRIIGNVYLGDGEDQLRAFGATIDGDIFGGTGHDTYFVDSEVRLIEYADFGEFDRVFARCNFELSDNLEGLYLSGTGDFTGRGGVDANYIGGNSGNNRLFGIAGNDTITAGNGDDAVNGGVGQDTLKGEDGDDVLFGGAGKDNLAGGTGADRFVFSVLTHSAASFANADVITDFTKGEDLIDLSAIDANTINAAANDAFAFIANAAFTNVAGQVRYTQTAGATFVEMDVNGDGGADGVIRLNGLVTLNANDFVL